VLIAASLIILLAAVGTAMSYGARLIALGTAYKAKMLCSEIFVAGRDTDAVLADLVVDDLAALRFIDASVDTVAKTTSASLHGLLESRVRYRDAVGCASAANGAIPVAWEINARKGPSSVNRTPSKGSPSVEPEKSISSENPRLAAVLDAAFSEPDPEHPRRTRAVVIMHGGHIVAERYAAGVGPDTPLLGWSMTKSVMNTLVGILVKQGRLALNTPVLADAWRGAGAPRGHITLEHLLHMSSGLAFDEDMADPLADVGRMRPMARTSGCAFPTSIERQKTSCPKMPFMLSGMRGNSLRLSHRAMQSSSVLERPAIRGLGSTMFLLAMYSPPCAKVDSRRPPVASPLAMIDPFSE
jgi:hypothetical protein